MASELESDLQDIVDWDRTWLVDFNVAKAYLVSFDWPSNTGAIDVKIDGFVLEEKSSFVDGVVFLIKIGLGLFHLFYC